MWEGHSNITTCKNLQLVKKPTPYAWHKKRLDLIAYTKNI